MYKTKHFFIAENIAHLQTGLTNEHMLRKTNRSAVFLLIKKQKQKNKTHYLLKICRQIASTFSLIMLMLLLWLPWIMIAWINAPKDWLLASRSISLCFSVRYCFVICNISLIVWIFTDTSETFSGIIQWRYDFPLLSNSERIMLSQNGAELED